MHNDVYTRTAIPGKLARMCSEYSASSVMRAVVFWAVQDPNRVTRTHPYLRDEGAFSAHVRIPGDEWNELYPTILPLLRSAQVTSRSRILFVLADQPSVTEEIVRDLLDQKAAQDQLGDANPDGPKRERAVIRKSGMVRLRDGMEPRCRRWAVLWKCTLSEAVHRMLDEKLAHLEQQLGVGAPPSPESLQRTEQVRA